MHLKVTGYKTPGDDKAEPEPADDIIISPDSSQAIASVNRKVYLVAVPITGGQTPTVAVGEGGDAPVPLRRLTRVGGDFLGWSPDGRLTYWSLGRSFFTYDIAAGAQAVRDSTHRADSVAKAAPKPEPAPDTATLPHYAYTATRFNVTLIVPKDRPSGAVVLSGARLITMKGDEIIPKGDIVVTNNRITAIGATGSVTVPANARRIDVTGKTIIPGYVDVHAHMWPAWGVHKTVAYRCLDNLAYGVTTTRDPQTSTTDVLTYGDLVETGEMIGPRIFTTGPGVFARDRAVEPSRRS